MTEIGEAPPLEVRLLEVRELLLVDYVLIPSPKKPSALT
jgi:hypothetical protein